jgi:hypothetical protein
MNYNVDSNQKNRNGRYPAAVLEQAVADILGLRPFRVSRLAV